MPVFAEGTPFEGLDPGFEDSLAPYDDEESTESGSEEIFAAGTDFEGLDPGLDEGDEQLQEVPEETGYLDQLRAGYYELRKAFAGSGAIDRLKTAKEVESGELALNEFGSVIPGREVAQRQKTNPKSLATPEQKEEFGRSQFVGAAEKVDEAGEFKLKADAIPFSEETLDFLDEKRGVPVGEAFMRAPFKIIAEIGLRSGVNSVPSIVAGAIGGAAGGIPGAMAGAGAASARIEYVNSLIDGLEKKGVDTLNVDALKDAVENEELMRDVSKRAGLRSAPIAALDAATFGIAGKTLTPFKAAAPRILGNLGAQAVVQAAGGAAGEKGAQLLTGERDDRAVYAEAVGELVTAPVDAAVAGSELVSGKKDAEADAGPSPLQDLERAQNAARDAVRERGGDNLEQELAASEITAEATALNAYKAKRQASIDAAYNEAEATSQVEGEAAVEALKRTGKYAGTDVDIQARVDQAMQRGEAMNQLDQEAEQRLANVRRPPSAVDQAMQRGEAINQVEQEAVAGVERSNASVDVTQQAEQRLQEELQGGQAVRDAAFDQAQPRIDKAAAFEQAEGQAAADIPRADLQRQQQLAEQPATEPSSRSLGATTTLEEAGPQVFKTLAERRAAIAAAPPVAAAAPPAAAPAAPKTLTERRAREAAADVVAPSTQNTPKVAAPVAPKTQKPQPPDPAPVEVKTPKAPKPAPTAAAAAVPAEQKMSREPRTLREQRKGPVKTAPAAAAPAATTVSDLASEVDAAAKRGETFKSESTVAAEEVRDFRALEAKGYVVTRNPSTRGKDGSLKSDTPGTPVFEVRKKNAKSAAPKQKFITVGGRVIEENEAKAAAEELDQPQRGRTATPKAEQVDQIYQEDLPSRGGLKSMPLKQTFRKWADSVRRQGREPSKAEFDKMMLERAKAGEIELVPYDDVKQLSAEDRADSIQDPENKNRVLYYWRPTENAADVVRSNRQKAIESTRKENDASFKNESDLRDNTQQALDEPRTSLSSAKRQLTEFFQEFGQNSVTLVERVDQLPVEIQNDIANIRVGNPRALVRGLYNRARDQVFIVADQHYSDQSVLETAAHEFIAHKGLRAFLGTERDKLFLNVFKKASAKGRTWMLEYAGRRGLDLRDPKRQIQVADEYIASLAERVELLEDVGLLQQILDALRAVFRKLRAVREYTDNDLYRLLRMSRASARSAARANDLSIPNYVGQEENDYSLDLRTPPQDRAPLQQLGRLGQTFEDQANYNPGTVSSRFDALKNFGEKRIGTLLGLIPRRNLIDFIAKGKMDAARRYLGLADRMDGRRNELMAETEKTAKKWMQYVKSNRQNARILGELMHAATLAGVDPLEPYVSSLVGKSPGRITPEARQLEADRKVAYQALSNYAGRLDTEAQSLYREVRDSYVKDRQRVMDGITERINASQASSKTKTELLDTLRKQFESGKVAGPYFPLARFGDYWAVARNAAGETVSYIRRENPSEVRAWREQMKAAGLITDGGMKASNTSAGLTKQIDPGFVAKVTDMANQIDPEFADQVWQMYLQSLPETSLRKQFTHRKGRMGYTADALRAFGHNKFHSAHQIAKLEFMHRMESELETMAVEARTLEQNGDPEEKWATPLLLEFKQRHEWARNPTNAAWANNLTALGFAYYLGTSPAAALVNLSQTAVVALPTIGAEFGMTKTLGALLKSAAQWAGSRGPLANRLRGDERLAFDEALRIGLFTQTRTTDLAELGQHGENIGSARETAMKIITWMFSKTEQANREITFLAAFRLAKEAGLSQDAAIERAENLTWDSHFQYNSTNRPRVMQGNGQKVLFLFRQYSMNMTYRLARDFNNSLPSSMPAEEKAKARKRLAGLLTMTFLNAGISGMPLVWLGYTVVGAMLGTDDEPYDSEASLRTWMEEWAGETRASMIMDGSTSTATGATLSSRVGLGNLWLQEKPTGMNATDEFGWWLAQAAGPIGGLLFKGLKANELAQQDYADRALEQASPKAISDVLKLIRYARDGVTNKRGDVLMAQDELSNYQLFLQAAGFVPLELTQQYEKNRAIKGEETKIMQRRATLMNRLFLAAQNEDPAMIQETLGMMRAFSRANPNVQIDASAIISSARQRARYSSETINGIRVEPKLRYLQRKYGNERRKRNVEDQNTDE